MRAVGWVALAVVVALTVSLPAWGPHMIDLEVYRLGAAALLHRVDLYSVTAPGTGLPFTYPAFAAVLFVPYALVPFLLAKIVTVLVTLGALWVVVWLTLHHTGGATAAWRWSPLLTVAAATTHPVLDTLLFGQVNVWLTALVMVDVLVLPSRWRGTLVGLATGIKLTSGLFIAYYLVTRQFRAALRATLTLLATVAVGFAVAPTGSWEYWTDLMFDAHRVGTVEYVTNQSILGVTARLTRDATPPTVLTAALSLVAAIATLVLAARVSAAPAPTSAARVSAARASAKINDLVDLGVAGDPQVHKVNDQLLLATTLVGVGALLASPISWSHHWIWIIPALGLLARWAAAGGWAAAGRWSVVAGWRWWVFGVVAAVLWTGPMRFVPSNHGAELHHTLAQQVVANCYGALAVGFVIWAAVRLRRAAALTPVPVPVPTPRLPVEAPAAAPRMGG